MKIKSAFQAEIEAREWDEPVLPDPQLPPVDMEELTNQLMKEIHGEDCH